MAEGTPHAATHEAAVQADVAIIGAGPTGLFAVFECGMLRMKCVVIDTLEAIGGQCAALYPEKPIYDIPAHPAIAGAELIARLEEQAAPFAPIYLLAAAWMRWRKMAKAVSCCVPARVSRCAPRP